MHAIRLVVVVESVVDEMHVVARAEALVVGVVAPIVVVVELVTAKGQEPSVAVSGVADRDAVGRDGPYRFGASLIECARHGRRSALGKISCPRLGAGAVARLSRDTTS